MNKLGRWAKSYYLQNVNKTGSENIASRQEIIWGHFNLVL